MASEIPRRSIFARIAATLVGAPIAVAAIASAKPPSRENTTFRRYSGYELLEIKAEDVFTGRPLSFNGIPIECDLA